MLAHRIKLVYIIIVILTTHIAGSERSKRSLMDLSDMILFTTGRVGLDFNKYGHFCGKGGHGQIVDKIDWCCNMHDKCYGEVQEMNKEKETKICHLYIHQYNWTIIQRNIVCNDSEYCSRSVCECDKTLAYCLGHFNMYYNQNFAANSRFQKLFHQAIHFLTRNRF